MCVSCGCGKPNENHGDPRHITMQQIQQAAEEAIASVKQGGERYLEEVKAAVYAKAAEATRHVLISRSSLRSGG